MGGLDNAPKPQEVPGAEAAAGIIDANLPPATELGVKAGREKSAKYKDVPQADIDSRADGLPRADKNAHPDKFENLKVKLHALFDSGYEGKWAPGLSARKTELKYNPSSKKMEGYDFVLVSGNKVDEYHFFGSDKIKREPTAEQKKDIKQQEDANKKEADEANRAEIDEQAEQVVKEYLNPDKPVKEVKEKDDNLARQAARTVKGPGEYGYVNGPNNTRCVVIWTEDKGKLFYKGEKGAKS